MVRQGNIQCHFTRSNKLTYEFSKKHLQDKRRTCKIL
jgi:hypothetical protein